jgi:hypothetical protein
MTNPETSANRPPARDGEPRGRLTAPERALIASARELARAEAPVCLRHYLRERGHELSAWQATDEFVYKTSLYSAQELLRQLADLAERLGRQPSG